MVTILRARGTAPKRQYTPPGRVTSNRALRLVRVRSLRGEVAKCRYGAADATARAHSRRAEVAKCRYRAADATGDVHSPPTASVASRRRPLLHSRDRGGSVPRAACSCDPRPMSVAAVRDGSRMPRTPRPLPSGLGTHFSVAQATAAGVSPRRLRASDLESPFRGTRRRFTVGTTSDEDDATPFARDRRVRAAVQDSAHLYATVMPPGSFFCGRTAAVLLGAPLGHGQKLEVAVCAPRRAPRARGIQGRTIAPHLVEVQVRGGLRITSPATTWAMLGRDLNERQLIVLGDALVRVPRDRGGNLHPELSLASLEHLQSAMDLGPRPQATARLMAALDRIRVGSASPLETEYRLDAESQGLPEPVLDMPIHDAHGRRLGISEVVYPHFRTVTEIEGDHHRVSQQQWDRDLAKYRAYAEAGWHVVRLTSRNIRGDHPDAITIVRRALTLRGWDGAPPPSSRRREL